MRLWTSIESSTSRTSANLYTTSVATNAALHVQSTTRTRRAIRRACSDASIANVIESAKTPARLVSCKGWDKLTLQVKSRAHGLASIMRAICRVQW